MRIPLLVAGISFYYLTSFAQYDNGTEIFKEFGSPGSYIIQELYKVGDFNEDGYIDIIMIKSQPLNDKYNLTWYKNNAGETFSEQSSLLNIEKDRIYDDIFLEDINRDGANDIVFQNYHTSFTLLNDGQGNVKEIIKNELLYEDTLYVWQDSVSLLLRDIADMDGDGDIDYIFSNTLIGYNDGSGLISGYEYIDSDINKRFSNPKAADIDGDSDMDIIVEGIDGIFIYENLQENGFTLKQKITDLDSPTRLKLQDIDNNNDCELLVETALFDIRRDPHETLLSYAHKFQILDYDVQKEVFFTLEVYDSWLHNYTVQSGRYVSRYNKFDVQYGHQNEDNNLDALSVNLAQGKLLWYLGDGKGGFEADQSQVVHTSNEYSTYKPALRLADVDNDGDLDVFVLLNTDITSTLTLFKNETTVSTANHNFVLGKMGITPNPVKGNSYVQLNLVENQYLSEATYNLYTIKGEKLMTGNLVDNRMFIPGFPVGMYLAEIILANKKYINKFIIN